jgi:Fe-Mn family superoxide dismutase
MNLQLNNLSYDVSQLAPVVSMATVQEHLKVYSKHKEDFDNGNGDIPFNKAGAYLHKLYFENLREYRKDNRPMGISAQILEMRYGTWENFVKTYQQTVAKLQGSGWVFMNTSGYLNIIPNNRIVDKIGFIIDFWEHAYYPEWGNNREAYAQHHLDIIDWDKVNQRILDSKDKKHKESSII